VTSHFQALVESAHDGVEAFLQTDRQVLVNASRAHLDAHWQSVRQRHLAGESGHNVLRALTQGADEVIRGIVEFGLAPIAARRQVMARTSVCALGGYGRAEMSPCSDLDLCLLYEGQFDADVEALNSFLVPFLWDIGLKVGYALHSVVEAYDLARTDSEVYTTYAQARLLMGSTSTFSRLKLQLVGLRSQPIAADVLTMCRRRERLQDLHESYRDLYAPEPNLKESVGGLRDYHSALWMINLQHGQLSIDDLARLGYLSAEEHVELAEGLDFLWRIRNEIHFHTGKSDNQLTFAIQRHLASALGYGSGTETAIARLMRDYYIAARRVRGALRLAERICNHEDSFFNENAPEEVPVGIEVRDARLYAGANDPNWFAESPPRLMEVFWASVRRGIPLSPVTEQAVRDHLYLVNDVFRGSDVVLLYFLAICKRPLQAGTALRQMASTGLLGAYLPEFAAVGGIVRYEDFHSYPVDEHTLRALEAIQRVYELEGNVARMLQKSLEHIRDPHVLTIAILFHDLGKADGEEHVEAGVRLAREMGARMGLPEDDIERIAFLVQHHMLMTHTSMYRDIDDPELVANFAETMKSVDRLRDLLLLSFADLSAVGPNVWTEWKGALLLKLFLRAERILLGRPPAGDFAFWEQPKATAIAEHLPEAERAGLTDYLKALGDRYFFAFSAEAIAAHMGCVAEARERGAAMVCRTHGDTGTSEVAIATRDRHGLFASIAGSFASQLVDVRGASLFGLEDGWVLDCFIVADAGTGRPLTDAQVEGLRHVLDRVLIAGEDVQSFVDQSRKRLFALLQPRTPVPTMIEFDNNASRSDTVIDIEAGDRTGLLYDMVRALADVGVDFTSAKIVTDARRARDSFYVRLNDKKIEDASDQQAIRDGLLAAISPWATADA
jgi:[protein-PII] uridylyltransferase